jgi:hypothetical protein
VCHIVLAQALGLTHQTAAQSILARATHGVPAHRAAGATRQAWPPARVVLGRLHRLSSIEATGEVYNRRDLVQFPGT